MLLLLLSACQDYDLGLANDVSALDWFNSSGPQQLAAPAVDRMCDQWAPELDEQVGVDESCVQEEETGALQLQTEWTTFPFHNYPEYTDVVMAPVVGQLTDDNGDGRVDSEDIPDIFVIADDPLNPAPNGGGVAYLLSGDDGSGHWAVHVAMLGDKQLHPYRYANAALGIVEPGGAPRIFTLVHVMGPPVEDSTTMLPDTAFVPGDSGDDPGGGGSIEGSEPQLCSAAAFDAQGEPLWVQEGASLSCGGHAPALADLDGDGIAELIVGNAVLDARDGRLLMKLNQGIGRGGAYSEMGSHPAVADLDGDGRPEVLAGRTLYDNKGQPICSVEGADGFPGVADLDMDGAGEFLLVADGQVSIHDPDCSALASWTLAGGGHGGPPTIADFDNDGLPEIGIAEAATYSVYEADGTLLWSMPVTDDSSHATGSAVYDFEGDGNAEVVYGDEKALWVFDGATGRVRLQDLRHESRTLHELPTIVDVDNDGRAEIVVVNGGSHYGDHAGGVYVLGGSDDKPWLGNRQVWNQHAYSIVNVDDDLRIPASPEPNWPTHNNFRSGDLTPVSGGNAGDAVPLVDGCVEECSVDQLYVAIGVGNMGTSPLRGKLPVALYAVESDGSRRLLQVVETGSEAVEPGARSDLVRVRMQSVDLPLGELEVVVDDSGNGVGQVRECHEDNNAVQITLSCP